MACMYKKPLLPFYNITSNLINAKTTYCIAVIHNSQLKVHLSTVTISYKIEKYDCIIAMLQFLCKYKFL